MPWERGEGRGENREFVAFIEFVEFVEFVGFVGFVGFVSWLFAFYIRSANFSAGIPACFRIE
jgi:hypothetical protein